MSLAALLLAAAALLVALLALARASRAKDAAEDAATAARRHSGNVEETLRGEVAVLRGLLKRLVGGDELTTEMVEEGQLWRDVDPPTARRMVEAGEVALLDVRTPQETAAGVIPGARLLPMDEIEERRREVPADGAVLVYCAGGGRSAAVCEYLSKEGYERVLNLTGGFGAWEGPVERPTTG